MGPPPSLRRGKKAKKKGRYRPLPGRYGPSSPPTYREEGPPNPPPEPPVRMRKQKV